MDSDDQEDLTTAKPESAIIFLDDKYYVAPTLLEYDSKSIPKDSKPHTDGVAEVETLFKAHKAQHCELAFVPRFLRNSKPLNTGW